jgi:hypothetical protein
VERGELWMRGLGEPEEFVGGQKEGGRRGGMESWERGGRDLFGYLLLDDPEGRRARHV